MITSTDIKTERLKLGIWIDPNLSFHRGVSNAAKLRARLRNLCNFTKITPGLHRDYTRFAQGLHIFAIQELAVMF